jgi:alpha-galactosidase
MADFIPRYESQLYDIESIRKMRYCQELFKRFAIPTPKRPTSCVGHWNFFGLAGGATTVYNKATATAGRNNLLESFATYSGNNSGESEPRLKDLLAYTGAVTENTVNLSDIGLGYYVAALHLPTSAFVRNQVTIPASTYTLSVFVVMDTSATLQSSDVGDPASHAIGFYYNGAWASTTVTAVAGVTNGYRLTAAITGHNTAGDEWRVYAGSTRSFSVTGWMINIGDTAATPLTYEKTPYMDMTLVGSPTIEADGVTFNGTSQYGVTKPHFILNDNWTVLAVVENQNTDGTTRVLMSVGQIANANHRIDVECEGSVSSLNADGKVDPNGHSIGLNIPMLYALEATASGVKLNNYVSAANGASTYDTMRGRLCIGARAIDLAVFSGQKVSAVMAFETTYSALSRQEMREAWSVMYHDLLTVGIDISVSIPPLITAIPRNNVTKPMIPFYLTWGFLGSNPSDAAIRPQVAAMASSGLRDAGWSLFEVDAFAFESRDESNQLVADPIRFPNGFDAVVDYIKANGMTYGFYTSVGNQPGSVNGVGCYGFEWEDARFAVVRDAKYVEDDSVTWPYGYNRQFKIWPNDIQVEYFSKMGTALLAQSQDIFYNVCGWSNQNVADSMETLAMNCGGNGLRFAGDSGVADTWSGLVTTLIFAPKTPETDGTYHTDKIKYVAPGFQYDPSTMHAGWGNLTQPEVQTEFSMYCLLKFELYIGYDIATDWSTNGTKSATITMLKNADTLAIYNDSLGLMGLQVTKTAVTHGGGADSYIEVWAKPLANGKWAIGLFNRGAYAHTVTVAWSDILAALTAKAASLPAGYPTCELSGAVNVKDVWNNTSTSSNGWSVTNLASHACALIIAG